MKKVDFPSIISGKKGDTEDYQDCQELLGSSDAVNKFGIFMRDNLHEIDAVRDAIIVKFARSGAYSSPETPRAVIGALNEFSDFFTKCLKETVINSKVIEAKAEISKLTSKKVA